MDIMENDSKVTSSVYIDTKPPPVLNSSIESSPSNNTPKAIYHIQEKKASGDTLEILDFPVLPADWELNNFLHELAQEITDDEVAEMKYLFRGEGGIGKRTLDSIKTAPELFDILRGRNFLNKDNLLSLQTILRRVGRKDLVQKAIEYADTVGNVLHFYPASDLPENGYLHVKMHVRGKDFKTCSRNYVNNLRHHVSKLLFIPLEFVFVQGIEPSSSMLITFMIPAMYAELLEEMLQSGQELAELRNLGVDMVKIMQCYNIQDVCDVEVVESDQQLYLTNVYQQLQQAKKHLEDTEVRYIELSRQSTSYEAQLIACKDKLLQAEEELTVLRAIFNCDDSKTKPATLASQSSLVAFENALTEAGEKHLDKGVLRRLIDSTTIVISTRMKESYYIQMQKMALEIQELYSRTVPTHFELKKYQTLADVDLEELEKALLDMFQRLSQTISIKVELSPQIFQILKSLSTSLRGNEREKLKRKYTWNADDKIKKMMRNQALFLAGIFYKEIERTQHPIDLESFVIQCLKDIGREDLVKRFMEWMKKQGYNKTSMEAKRFNKEAGTTTNSTDHSEVINRMAEQVETIYNAVQSAKSFDTSHQDLWKSPTFAYGQRPPPYPGF